MTLRPDPHAYAAVFEHTLDAVILATTDGVILDAGVSSMQLDQPARGFSFRQRGPLDMRMDQSQGQTAADIVNGTNEADLAALIDEFGEERYARRVAAAIVSFVRAMPLALRTANGLHLSHSLPSPYEMEGFDLGILERPLADADYEHRTGSAWRMAWNAAERLSAITASQRSGGKSSTAATCWMPALLTRMSSAPKRSSV